MATDRKLSKDKAQQIIDWVKECREQGQEIDPALLAGHRPDPPVADAEELAGLASALAALPPRQREAVACRYLRRMSVRETAATMGCAEGTVKAAVFAALRGLRKSMASHLEAGRR